MCAIKYNKVITGAMLLHFTNWTGVIVLLDLNTSIGERVDSTIQQPSFGIYKT